ncbi:hypothetical protein OESDEN_03364 [Oesophagostomum dentatum]|uniref:Uncharacterized protein n=1 Tax=Oesophagostomum dentatum TaxID=61180 RepID=A0A0B1THG9_OESDE|nr:hypothetical protein OESDEN_03364 [Oesophagostomum dentatum]
MPYFLVFLFITAAADYEEWMPWEMVEVKFATEHNTGSTNNDYLHISDDYITLFDEFAAKHGIHFNKRNFRLFGTYPDTGLTTFGMRAVNCEQFRMFLSGITAQKYHIEYASVKCAELSFTLCLTFSCDIYNNHSSTIVSTTMSPLPTTTTTTPQIIPEQLAQLFGQNELF